MDQTKPFWASTTLWGAVAAFVGVVLPGLGVDVRPEQVNQFFDSFTQALDSCLTFGGMAVTVYGRFIAKKRLGLTWSTPPQQAARGPAAR